MARSSSGASPTKLLCLYLLVSLLPAAPPNRYLDPQICSTCHRQIAESYARTGMGRSFYKPTGANTVEDYANHHEFTHPLSDTHYSMNIRDGAFYQRRWQLGFDGKESNIEELQIDYVIGSGNHSRSYLHRASNGGLIELPLSWYSEQGGYWEMSPGFDSRHPPTRRFVSYECMFCHNAVPQIPSGHDAPGSDPIFPAVLPQGIDCQRCHGPGGRHVQAVQTPGAKAADIRASIINPARLNPARSMDVCMQCHLEPTSTGLPSLIRRYNRGPFSFVPGEPLSNFVLAFDHAPGTGHDDKFEIVGSSAYRLRKSQCFLKSNGKLTCLTCHNPHAAPHYSQACRQCHAALPTSHSAASECVSCHMMKRRTDDVVHVLMTDHFIQRRPSTRNLLAPEDYRGEVVPYYPPDPPPLYRAVAQGAQSPAQLAREIEKIQPREAEFYMVLGEAWQSRGNPREAVAAFERAMERKPNSARELISLAGAFKASGQISPADETLKHALQIAPRSAPAWFQSGVVDYTSGQTQAALEKMQQAVTLDPDLLGGRRGLAELLWRTGQMDRAEENLREALRTDPYDADAYDLIGRVLAGKTQMPEALFDFEKATRLRPGYAPHLYDYALALSGGNRLEDAQTAVDAALRADPNMAEAHALLGGLFSARRLLKDAAREYAEAVRLKPDFARAHLDLARVLAAQGDMLPAIAHLRQAAAGSDPQVAQLATQALHQLGQ